MADVVVIEFSAPQAEEIYKKVNALMGLDADGGGEWPAGLINHVAAASGDKLIVTEVWDFQASQEEFMHSRLGPAFVEANAPAPARVEWFRAIGQMHRH